MKTIEAQVLLAGIVPGSRVVGGTDFPPVGDDSADPEPQAFGVVVVLVLAASPQPGSAPQTVNHVGIVIQEKVLVEKDVSVQINPYLLPGADADLAGCLRPGNEKILQRPGEVIRSGEGREHRPDAKGRIPEQPEPSEIC